MKQALGDMCLKRILLNIVNEAHRIAIVDFGAGAIIGFALYFVK